MTGLDLTFTIDPLRLPASQRGRVVVTLGATNRGQHAVDPQLGRTELLVNGRPSKAWSLAVANGKRESAWFSLPAGKTVSLSLASLGPSLFPGPGRFHLVLQHGDHELDPVAVEIMND